MEQIIVFKRSEIEDWRLAEIEANAWFKRNGMDSTYMDLIKKNCRGFDLLVEDTYRINVKYANHTKRSENEFLFKTNKKKHGVKTTDYYLFMFRDLHGKSGKYKYRAYLVPYEDMPFSNTITITKTKLAKWTKYKLNVDNLGNLGIHKVETEELV